MERADDHRSRPSAPTFRQPGQRRLLRHLQLARGCVRLDLVRDGLHAQLHRTDGRGIFDGGATIVAGDAQAAPSDFSLQAAVEPNQSEMAELVLPTSYQEARQMAEIHHRHLTLASDAVGLGILPSRLVVGSDSG